jgi:hypothetical protein
MPDFSYQGWSLDAAIDALKAYDRGATDSGVHDDDMRTAVRQHLLILTDRGYRATVARMIREMVSEGRIEEGYGPEDVRALLDWIDELLIGDI